MFPSFSLDPNYFSQDRSESPEPKVVIFPDWNLENIHKDYLAPFTRHFMVRFQNQSEAKITKLSIQFFKEKEKLKIEIDLLNKPCAPLKFIGHASSLKISAIDEKEEILGDLTLPEVRENSVLYLIYRKEGGLKSFKKSFKILNID